MQEDIGWGSHVLFGALAVRQLLGGLLGPVIGPIVDTPRGARIMMPLGGLLLGLSLILVYWANSPLMFLLTYGFLGALAFAMLNTAMWDAIILKWFIRTRAKALVWASFGAASAAMISPLVVTFLILYVGWREAWLWYGIGIMAILVPIAMLVRGSPESVGMTPDGISEDDGQTQAQAIVHITPGLVGWNLTRNDALHSRAFWLISGAFALSAFGINSFQAHWIPYLVEVGFSTTIAALAVSVYGGSNIISRVIWGWLSTRWPIKRLVVIDTIMAGIGVGLILAIQNTPMLFFWAMWHGLFLGSYNYLNTLLTAEYFGRTHIGAIRGSMLPAAAICRSGGPLLLGLMHGLRGTYTLPFLVVWSAWAGVTLAILGARRPRQSP